MKKQHILLLLSFLLVLATFLAIFFFFRSHQLQNELNLARAKAQSQREAAQITFLKRLLAVDSMLVDGDYRSARLAYEELLQEIPKDDELGNTIQLRLRNLRTRTEMQEKLAVYEGEEPLRKLSEQLSAKNQQIDSLNQVLLASESEQSEQFDSLRFALEKAQMRTKSLQTQLAHKADQNFLTFSNDKGVAIYYVGEVKNKQANGRGVGLYSTGSRYEGEWKNNLRHGQGVFYWPDGEYYQGNFQEDERHGQGDYYWPNGEKFSGEWKDDQRNGPGTMYGKNGNTIASGTWQNNKLVERNE